MLTYVTRKAVYIKILFYVWKKFTQTQIILPASIDGNRPILKSFHLLLLTKHFLLSSSLLSCFSLINSYCPTACLWLYLFILLFQQRKWSGWHRCALILWYQEPTRLPSAGGASLPLWDACLNPGNGGRRRVRSSSRPLQVRAEAEWTTNALFSPLCILTNDGYLHVANSNRSTELCGMVFEVNAVEELCWCDMVIV